MAFFVSSSVGVVYCVRYGWSNRTAAAAATARQSGEQARNAGATDRGLAWEASDLM